MIQSLWIQNFRNIQEVVLKDIQSHLFIFGENNQGKTNLLESIYLLRFSKSFRSVPVDNFVCFGKEKTTLGVNVCVEDTPHHLYLQFHQDQTKVIEWNQKRIHHISKFPFPWNMAYINADVLRVFQESPGYRRDLLDQFISRVDVGYLSFLTQYNQLLKQKNSLLKLPQDSRETLAIYHHKMVELADKILVVRQNYLDLLTQKSVYLLNEVGILFGSDIQFTYHIKGLKVEGDMGEYRDWLIQKWEESYEKERVLGYCLYGPHMDDYDFKINTKSLTSYFSRGINRIIALVLTLSQLIFNPKDKTIVLLDDPFVELDDFHKEKIIHLFQKYTTCFYTSVMKSDLSFMQSGTQVIQIKNGVLQFGNY